MKANDWHDPEWVAAAHEWIMAHLDAPATGPIVEVRVRPWSVTHRVSTAAGTRWFKANTAACAYEAPLAAALAGWVPDAVLAPLAVDDRGWLLSADAGPTLRDEIGAGPPVETWARMLQAYAVLQRETAARADEMVALGVPDMRLPLLPGLLKGFLASVETEGDVAAVPFADWCAELAADGLPAALQHDDLTDANVFPVGPRGFRFFDWGDACVSHPFGTMLVALGFAAHLLKLEPGAAELARLRDAYLEPWTDLAPATTLRRSVSLAYRIDRVPRALAWQRAVQDAALPVDEDFRTAAAYWVGELPAPAVI
ncbi:hypothetical protein BJ973_002190 [Actinoplanes tereljensis]|uniref:Phosphotransferase n=1 Tax=Paractinoplanes tereljensis TaxID=571912 RepID=A0A919NNP5_9ACTN|nr:hypothetical protein [Actinoplanes tereljensis]GIF21863.1 phosphotransferase [Actinoplanes tereljensis]